MRNLVVLASLCSLGAIAYADAGPGEPDELSRIEDGIVLVHAANGTPLVAPVPPPPTTTYVEVGVLLGADGLLVTALDIAGGHRLAEGSHFWFHGELAIGAGEEILSAGAGSFFRVSAGVEARGCAIAALCARAGIDVGFQGASFVGEPGESGQYTAAVAIPQVGLDVGSRELRLRPSIDLALAMQGPIGADAKLALAYLF